MVSSCILLGNEISLHKGVMDMSRTDVVKIAPFEVKKSDIEKIKKAFKVKDNVAAMQKALDVATGKIEIESVFERHQGAKIRKVYV